MLKALDLPDRALRQFTIDLLQRLGPSARPILVRMIEDPIAAQDIGILQALVEADAAHRLDWMQRLFDTTVESSPRGEDYGCDDDIRVSRGCHEPAQPPAR